MRNESERLKAKLIFPLLLVLTCACAQIFAQDEAPQIESLDATVFEEAPPPIYSISNAEKLQLSAEQDIKRRTQLCLDLANARLQRAEEMTVGDRFGDALLELGGYQALIENGLNFLKQQNDDSRRARDNFRRLEMALRGHAPRLETIRRTTPFEHAVHLKGIMKFARDARANALDSFFSDTVVTGEISMKTNQGQIQRKP